MPDGKILQGRHSENCCKMKNSSAREVIEETVSKFLLNIQIQPALVQCQLCAA